MERDLDFVLIGVQKGGTTSLWQYLRFHPRIAMPDYKEAPIFCLDEERIPGRLKLLMESTFTEVPADARLGKVATYYMMGEGSVDVDRVVERMSRVFPEIRLIALLRDPIERAMSHYRMSVRRGLETRSFDTVVRESMEADQLRIGRSQPSETNSYIVQGEYGRILSSYRQRFAAEQIHVEATTDLARDPGGVLDRVLEFLGLDPGYRPDSLGVHYHRGGSRPRLDPEEEAELRDYLVRHVWPRLGAEAQAVKDDFAFFFQIWNVIPDDQRPPLSESNRSNLEAHYRADGRLLAELEIEAPWLDGWTA